MCHKVGEKFMISVKNFFLERKVLEPNGPFRHESDKTEKFLSVGNFGILSVVIVYSTQYNTKFS